MLGFTLILTLCSTPSIIGLLMSRAVWVRPSRISMTSDKVAQIPLKIAVTGAGVGGTVVRLSMAVLTGPVSYDPSVTAYL